MFDAFVDRIWDALGLLAFALAPYAAPFPLPGRAVGDAARAALEIVLLAAVAAWLFVLWRNRQRVSAALAGTAVVAAIASSVFLRGEHGPALLAACPVGALAWCAAGSLVIGALRARGSLQLGRSIAIVAVAIGSGAVGFVVAMPRVRSREAMWRSTLANAPGRESDAVAFAAFLAARGQSDAARTVVAACAAASAAACDCHAVLADAFSASGMMDEATGALDHATPSCRGTTRLSAIRAEILAARGAADDAIVQADAVLAKDPTDAHAVYAKALALAGRHDLGAARALAEQALLLKRGTPADLLLGYLKMQQGDLDGAQAVFELVLSRDSRDSTAVYNLAVIANRRGHYREAREGYLEALRLNPRELSARYDLAVMAHGIGADMEARHHFDEFQKAAPADPRVAVLGALLR